MHSLFPIETETREIKSLDGIWNFKIDLDDIAGRQRWESAFPKEHGLMPVPSSINDIGCDAETRDHVGDFWYERSFFLPAHWDDRDIFVRFGSVTHHASVWVNGKMVAEHKGGYLPFGACVNEAVHLGTLNRITVRVNNVLDWTTLPPGETVSEASANGATRRSQSYFHDFFNYCGIHRPVNLVCLPKIRVENISVDTGLEDSAGVVDYAVDTNAECLVKVRLLDEAGNEVAAADGCTGKISIPDPILWRPLNGYLYTLEAAVFSGSKCCDVYRLPVGIRTVEVKGSQFLINGEPFYFRGYGWHEDSDIRGKGFDAPTMLRDLNLMLWSGANSFRTSHYPYSEECLRTADRLGLVVIAETPAVGLFDFRPTEPLFCEAKASSELQKHHIDCVRDLIARDRNHPCIVMWSIANEPMNNDPGAFDYFEPIVREARRLDPGRPITIVDHLEPEQNNLLSLSDVICINKYHGWYDHAGDLDGVESLFMDTFRRFIEASGHKPLILSEHGVDTIAGLHQLPPVMFCEEYQCAWLKRVHQALDKTEGIVGEHVWALADFATKQAVHRVNGNKKGIFTRQRQPKMAAFYLRQRWHHLLPSERPAGTLKNKTAG